jgi:hypothetical protein
MEPSINVAKLFGVTIGRTWPVVNRGNAINRVQKILKENHVTGVPSHWPKIYYGQTRTNLNLNRTYRNTDAATLPDGVYLYLIEYNPVTNRYHKSFVRVHNLLEAGSRHFQLPTRNQGRVIVAAGELSKEGRIIKFNLESGTYTRNLMTKTKNYMTNANYTRLVKNALRNVNANKNYITNVLIPKIPGSLKNLLNRGNVSFYFGNSSNKTRARVIKELREAGLNTNSASNLIRKLISEGPPKKTGDAQATPQRLKRKPTTNGNTTGAPQVHGRSGRTAGRI